MHVRGIDSNFDTLASMIQPKLQETTSSSGQRFWWLLLPLIFIATIPIWLAICLNSQWPVQMTASSFLLFGLLVHYCASLGFWLGSGSAWWRWIVIAIFSPILGFFGGINAQDIHVQLQFHFFCLSIIGLIGLTTFLLRLWNGRLELVASQGVCVDALQFGIKEVLIWITAICVFLGFVRIAIGYVFENEIVLEDYSEYLLIFVLAFSISTAIVVNIWAMLGNRVSVIKLLALVLVTAAAMLVTHMLDLRSYFFSCVTLIAQFLMVFMLVVLRRQGWRFVKCKND